MYDKPHILVVDDEPGPRESLKIILKPEFEVSSTSRGSEAIELLRTGKFEVVLLDLTMPDDLSGTETLRAIRANAVEVEAIVITGQGTLDTAVECMRLGARDYIAKPYRSTDVVTAVRNALAAHAARRRAAEIREHFLGNLSHEFRNPLNEIVGYSEILHDEIGTVLSGEGQHAVARIQLNSERLLSYLEGLFFLTELNSGELRSRPREFAVRPWLERLLQPIRREASFSGTTIELRCDEGLVGLSDPHTLSRLMTVLIYEAAGGARGSAIDVIAERRLPRGLELTIEYDPAAADPGLAAARPVGGDAFVSKAGFVGEDLASKVVSNAAAVLDARVETHLLADGRIQLSVRVGEFAGDAVIGLPHPIGLSAVASGSALR
jgi:FixJ family two-component response regulator